MNDALGRELRELRGRHLAKNSLNGFVVSFTADDLGKRVPSILQVIPPPASSARGTYRMVIGGERHSVRKSAIPDADDLSAQVGRTNITYLSLPNGDAFFRAISRIEGVLRKLTFFVAKTDNFVSSRYGLNLVRIVASANALSWINSQYRSSSYFSIVARSSPFKNRSTSDVPLFVATRQAIAKQSSDATISRRSLAPSFSRARNVR